MSLGAVETTKKHWTFEKDSDDIGWLLFDQADSPVNVLNSSVMFELDAHISQIASEKLKGLIITSTKESGFIAGADITEIEDIHSEEEAVEKTLKGHDIIQKIEDLPFPSLALISGFCLGGGLELALGCTYRIAEDVQKTRLGLPEVMLGLNPGWGGTLRLPKLIGAPAAFNLILNGHNVSAKSAERLGLVDKAVPSRHLKAVARRYILTGVKPHQATRLQSLSNQKLSRTFLAKAMRKRVQQRVREEHYPAPFAIIDAWEKYGVDSKEATQKSCEVFGRLLQTDTAKNLIRVFFLQEKLKRITRNIDFKAKHVHVVGAGIMGGDIAAWCALRGLNVTLQDREPKFISPAIKRAHELFKRKLKKPRPIQEAMDRLMPDEKGDGIAKADVIIEAIFENLEVKQNLFKELEAKSKPDAVLATNTSSIPLKDIGEALTNPDRLVGIHFFNPVAKMPLVEIVYEQKTSSEVIQHAEAFVKQISRLALPVKSSPCFLVNRVLAPYLLEAALLLEEGVAPELLDKAMEHFGMPMGPAELIDTVGLDVGMSVAQKYASGFGGEVPDNFSNMVEKGHLGRKTNQGIYAYKKGKAQKDAAAKKGTIPEDVSDRLVLRMINEAVATLREEIVANKEELDAGMIFGTGFAPFRGGPMKYIETQGHENLLKRLEALESRYGERFKPDAGWHTLFNDKAEQQEALKAVS